MRSRHLSGLVLLFLFTVHLPAQPFPGLSLDNYSGVNGLLLNPAHAADNNVKFELHLASARVSIGNDYLALPSLSQLIDDEEIYDPTAERRPSPYNFLATGTDVLGPSVLFALGDRFGAGILTRFRAMYDFRGLDGRVLEGQQDGFGDIGNFSGTFENFRTHLHGWGEASLVLGGVLVDDQRWKIKGGAAVKVLRGAGGYYGNSPSVTLDYDATAEELTTGGTLEYGHTGDISYEDFDPGDLSEDLGKGVGFDVGIVAEWYPDEPAEGVLRRPYRLKLGASLVDLGSVTYDNLEVSSYRTDAVIPAGDIEESSLEDILDRYYDGTTREAATDFRLPTALYLYLDYRLTRKLYVSVLSASAMGDTSEKPGTRIENAFTITPRLETKWLGLYLPARLGGPSGTAVGAGLRFKFITVGSGTLLSYLFTDTNYAADVYAGVKLPFYRRTKEKELRVE